MAFFRERLRRVLRDSYLLRNCGVVNTFAERKEEKAKDAGKGQQVQEKGFQVLVHCVVA